MTSRRRYFEGSDFARDLRAISTRQFRDVVGTYGIRSALYAEMVFANAPAVDSLRGAVPQERIYAMRTTRGVTLQEIVRATGLSEREVKADLALWPIQLAVEQPRLRRSA